MIIEDRQTSIMARKDEGLHVELARMVASELSRDIPQCEDLVRVLTSFPLSREVTDCVAAMLIDAPAHHWHAALRMLLCRGYEPVASENALLLWRALGDPPLGEPFSLPGACLAGANLDGAVLADANLHGARLTEASLVGAQLDGADLGDAELVHARCIETDFDGCDLRGAQLDGLRALLVKGTPTLDEQGERLWAAIPRTSKEVQRRLRARIEGPRGTIVRSIAFSPDGGSLAVGSYDGSVGLVDVGSGQARELSDLDAIVWSVAFSPDGGSLAVGSVGSVRVLDAADGAVEFVLEEVSGKLLWWIDGSYRGEGDAERWLRYDYEVAGVTVSYTAAEVHGALARAAAGSRSSRK